MATREQLEAALRAADAAGNVEDARALAAALAEPGPTALQAGARAAERGITAEFSDEIRGLLGTRKGVVGTFGERYRSERDEARREAERAAEAWPKLTAAGQVGGSAMAALAGAPALRAAGLAGAPQGASLGTRLLQSTGPGMALGAAYGAGQAPELRDVPMHAVGGAAVGAAAGPAVELAGAGIQVAGRGLENLAARNAVRATGAPTAALSKLARKEGAGAIETVGQRLLRTPGVKLGKGETTRSIEAVRERLVKGLPEGASERGLGEAVRADVELGQGLALSQAGDVAREVGKVQAPGGIPLPIRLGPQGGLRVKLPKFVPPGAKARAQDVLGRAMAGKPEVMSGPAATKLAVQAEKQGGFTYDPRTLQHSERGYAFSVSPENEKVIPKLTPKALKQYAEEHADELAQPQNRLGAWNDGKQWYLDVSTVLPDRGQALELAAKAGQKAIFDLSKQESIDVATPAMRTLKRRAVKTRGAARTAALTKAANDEE